jgi:hypothetical protein
MLSVKESLHRTLDMISDEDALRVLTFIEQMRRHPRRSLKLKRLAGDPMFKVPPRKLEHFANVDPVEGQGVPASQMLLEDRR